MKWQYYDIRTMTAEEYDRWYGQMDPARQQKTDAMRREEDRRCTVAADHLLLQRVAQVNVAGDPFKALTPQRGDHIFTMVQKIAPFLDGFLDYTR